MPPVATRITSSPPHPSAQELVPLPELEMPTAPELSAGRTPGIKLLDLDPDVDKDGLVSKSEQKLFNRLRKADVDCNGVIDVKEFYAVLLDFYKIQKMNLLYKWFAVIFLLLSILLAGTSLGTSLWAAELAKDTKADHAMFADVDGSVLGVSDATTAVPLYTLAVMPITALGRVRALTVSYIDGSETVQQNLQIVSQTKRGNTVELKDALGYEVRLTGTSQARLIAPDGAEYVVCAADASCSSVTVGNEDLLALEELAADMLTQDEYVAGSGDPSNNGRRLTRRGLADTCQPLACEDCVTNVEVVDWSGKGEGSEQCQYQGTYTAAKTIDDDLTTTWNAHPCRKQKWHLTYDLGEQRTVNKVLLRSNSVGGHNPKAFRVYKCTSDNSCDTLLKTCSGRIGNTLYQACSLDPTDMQYVKLEFDGWGPSMNWQYSIADVLFGAQPLACEDCVTNVEVVDWSGKGEGSEQCQYQGTYTAAKTIDDDLTTTWNAHPCRKQKWHLTYDLGEQRTVNKVLLRSNSVGGHNPKAFRVYKCTSDNSCDTLLKTCSGRIGNTLYQACSLHPTDMQYVKLEFDGWGPSRNWQYSIADVVFGAESRISPSPSPSTPPPPSPATRFVTLTSGICAEAGYARIDDEATCEEAMKYLGVLSASQSISEKRGCCGLGWLPYGCIYYPESTFSPYHFNGCNEWERGWCATAAFNPVDSSTQCGAHSHTCICKNEVASAPPPSAPPPPPSLPPIPSDSCVFPWPSCADGDDGSGNVACLEKSVGCNFGLPYPLAMVNKPVTYKMVSDGKCFKATRSACDSLAADYVKTALVGKYWSHVVCPGEHPDTPPLCAGSDGAAEETTPPGEPAPGPYHENTESKKISLREVATFYQEAARDISADVSASMKDPGCGEPGSDSWHAKPGLVDCGRLHDRAAYWHQKYANFTSCADDPNDVSCWYVGVTMTAQSNGDYFFQGLKSMSHLYYRIAYSFQQEIASANDDPGCGNNPGYVDCGALQAQYNFYHSKAASAYNCGRLGKDNCTSP